MKIGLRKKGVLGVDLGKIEEKSTYAKTGGPINMISWGFAARVTIHIVLKFGNNWPKGRGVTGDQFGEN